MGPATLICLLLAQDPSPLAIGEAWHGRIGDDAAIVRTPALEERGADDLTLGVPFLLRVSESGKYVLDLWSHDFDAYLVLRGPKDALLAEVDDGYLGTHARLAVELVVDLEYRGMACALHRGSGTFRLTLRAETGDSWTAAEKRDAEIEDARQRIAHLESQSDQTGSDLADRLHRLGEGRYHAGHFEAARLYFVRALAIREEALGPDHVDVGTSLNDLAAVLQKQGHFLESNDLSLRALRIRENALGREHEDVASTLNNLAVLAKVLGRYEEVRPLYERALAIREKVNGVDHPETAGVLGNMAVLLLWQGRNEEARPLLQRALRIQEKALGPEHPRTLRVLGSLAVLLKNEHRSEEARPLFERILEARERVLGPLHPDTAKSMFWLGSLLRQQGRFEDAGPLLERSLEIQEEALGLEHPSTADTLRALALVRMDAGRNLEARALIERALAINEKIFGPDHPNTSTSLATLAYLVGKAEAAEKALPLYERVCLIREQGWGPDHPQTGLALYDYSAYLSRIGRYEEAQLPGERAVEVLMRTYGPGNALTGKCLRNLAVIHRSLGRHLEASQYQMRSLRASLWHLERELPTMSEAGRLRFLEVFLPPLEYLWQLTDVEDPDLGAAFELYVEWKGKATRLQLASLLLSRASDREDLRRKRGDLQELSKQLSNKIFLPLARQEEGHAERIEEMRQERLRLERELNRELGITPILEVPKLSEIQAALPADAVLVDFYVDRQVFAWVIRPEQDPELRRLGEGSALRDAQEALLRNTATRGGRAVVEEEQDPAAVLRELLWDPIQELVGSASTVIVSPDGFLCELPLGVLKNADGSFLIEKHRLNYISDPSALVGLKPAAPDRQGDVLAVGDVDYFRRGAVPAGASSLTTSRSRIGDTWSSLEATREEIRSLRDLHQNSLQWDTAFDQLDGQNATEEQVRLALPGHRYVHLATHGYFEPEHLPSLLRDASEYQSDEGLAEQVEAVGMLPGLLSGLVFAGVNAEPDPARDDGYLSAEEIQHLDLAACDLAVLSACETALGSERSGEGLMSLRRAFEVAGAQTVVSSLWKVDDRASARIMAHFYQNYWAQGMDKGEALHQAKLLELRQNRADFQGDARPSTWGAFVLSGEWR